MKLFDYSNVMLDNNEYFAGISYFPIKEQIIGDDVVSITQVSLHEQYRADLIADRLWGLPDLNWVLDILNDFETGIKEYKVNTEIKYVSLLQLKKIGII
jgi:hypothetical protein